MADLDLEPKRGHWWVWLVVALSALAILILWLFGASGDAHDNVLTVATAVLVPAPPTTVAQVP